MKFLGILSFLILFSDFCSGQTFDYSYTYEIDTLIDIQLIEQTSDNGFICLSNEALFKVDAYGLPVWSYTLEIENLKALKLDPLDNSYITYQVTVDADYIESHLLKLNAEGELLWKKKFGTSVNEVEIWDLNVQDTNWFYAAGRMQTDEVWHNVIMKFDSDGNEVHFQRIYRPEETYHCIKKISKVKDGKIYLLAQEDRSVTVYEYAEGGELSGLQNYIYGDSVEAVDIIANGPDDIQVLLNVFEFREHFISKTLLKLQLDHNLSILHAKEYEIFGQDLIGIDLEVKNNRCYLMANVTSGEGTTLIERTKLSGDHSLLREIRDQSKDQFASDFEIRSDHSLVLTYKTEDETILSGTNAFMQSNCGSDLAEISVSDVTVEQSIAVPLTYSPASPIINVSLLTLIETELPDVTPYCFGYATIEERTVQIRLYPNPAADEVQIDGFDENINISIYDLNGRLIAQHENQNKFSVTDLDPGFYICEIRVDDTSFIKRLEVVR